MREEDEEREVLISSFPSFYSLLLANLSFSPSPVLTLLALCVLSVLHTSSSFFDL